MNEYVLFTPVSDKDFVFGDYDGAALHIIRHYQPKKVYIFLTAEMREKYKNSRFQEAVKHRFPEIEFEIIESDITDPSDFNLFFREFPKILEEIQAKNLNSKILLNITSGTPQMMMALACLSVIKDNYIPIQAKTPFKKSNANLPQDKSKLFEKNSDDLGKTEKRTVEAPLYELKGVLLKEQLASLVENYDYYGANTLCKENETYFKSQTIAMVKHAYLRSKLQFTEAIKADDDETLRVDIPENAKNAYEYYLVTKIKMLTGDYNSFALNIKILAEELALIFLTEKQVNFNDFADCIYGVWRFRKNRAPVELKALLDTIYENPFNNNAEINLAARIQVIKHYLSGENERITNNLSIINRENDLRNDTAHRLIYVERTAFQTVPEDLCNAFEALFKYMFGITQFDVYENINTKIKNSLPKVIDTNNV